MIDPEKKASIAQLLDKTYKQVKEYGEDMVITSDVQTLFETNNFGFPTIAELNELLEQYGFHGERIKTSHEKLWRVEVK